MSESTEISDDIVAEYLFYKGYRETLKSFEEDRQVKSIVSARETNREIYGSLIESFLRGDYSTSLTLWNNHVISEMLTLSRAMQSELKKIEFYVNIYMATYPFRNSSIEAAGSPDLAAKDAARAMTIFKHFLESRGKDTLKTSQFQIYKDLPKIAFPPTHPKFSHLFRSDWIDDTEALVLSFLKRIFQPKVPKLIKLVSVYEAQIKESGHFKQRKNSSQHEKKRARSKLKEASEISQDHDPKTSLGDVKESKGERSTPKVLRSGGSRAKMVTITIPEKAFRTIRHSSKFVYDITSKFLEHIENNTVFELLGSSDNKDYLLYCKEQLLHFNSLLSLFVSRSKSSSTSEAHSSLSISANGVEEFSISVSTTTTSTPHLTSPPTSLLLPSSSSFVSMTDDDFLFDGDHTSSIESSNSHQANGRVQGMALQDTNAEDKLPPLFNEQYYNNRHSSGGGGNPRQNSKTKISLSPEPPIRSKHMHNGFMAVSVKGEVGDRVGATRPPQPQRRRLPHKDDPSQAQQQRALLPPHRHRRHQQQRRKEDPVDTEVETLPQAVPTSTMEYSLSTVGSGEENSESDGDGEEEDEVNWGDMEREVEEKVDSQPLVERGNGVSGTEVHSCKTTPPRTPPNPGHGHAKRPKALRKLHLSGDVILPRKHSAADVVVDMVAGGNV